MEISIFAERWSPERISWTAVCKPHRASIVLLYAHVFVSSLQSTGCHFHIRQGPQSNPEQTMVSF